MPLPRSFYARPTLAVARDLIGSVLVVCRGRQRTSGRIVEVEAYLGPEDPASHAASRTARSEIMFGPPGVAYVYFIYGMHHCLNVVTEEEGTAGAVLIRALQPLAGLHLMQRCRQRHRGRSGPALPESKLCSGPGKLCQALGIDLAWNGLSLLGNGRGQRRVWLEPCRERMAVQAVPRLGIRRARELPYRFVAGDARWLSAPARPPRRFDTSR